VARPALIAVAAEVQELAVMALAAMAFVPTASAAPSTDGVAPQALTVAEVRPSRCRLQLRLPLGAHAATVLAATAFAQMASAAHNMDGVEPPVLIVVVAP
jgi:lauroyl/myristoyl acyltransferase